MSGNIKQALKREGEVARRLLAKINALIGEDEIARADAVEGETQLFEAIDQALDRLNAIDALNDGIKAVQESLKARAKRLEAQEETICSALLDALDDALLTKVERPLGTVYVAKLPRQLEIIDEAKISPRFWTQPKAPEPRLDKVALKQALDAGEIIEGAALDNGARKAKVRRG